MANKELVILKNIIYSILSDRDRLDIIDHIIARLTEIAGIDTYLDKVRNTLISTRERLYAAVTKEHGSVYTKSILADNKLRKSIIAKLYGGLDFFIDDEDKDVADAAKLIFKSLIKYLKNLPDSKKRTFSAAIKNFLKEMSTPEAVAALEKIGFTKRVDQLQNTQDRMDQKLEQRAQDEEMDDTPTLLTARNEMRDMIDVLGAVLFHNVFLNEPGMEELVHKLNGRIGEIMTTAKALHTMEENGHLKDDGDESSDADDEIEEVAIPEEETEEPEVTEGEENSSGEGKEEEV